MRRFFALSLLSLLACASGDATDAHVVRGTVVDTRGAPLAGARIVVDDTQYLGGGPTGATDSNGTYELTVPDGSWFAYAYYEREYLDRVYTIELHPLTNDSFAGVDGAVRDFEWRLSGDKPAPMVGTYGGTLYVWVDPDASVTDGDDVELTLVPEGPLLDGSDGATLTARPEGGLVEDVPLGRYRVRARHGGRDLVVKVQDTEEDYAPEATGVFEPLWDRELCHDCLRIEVAEP